MEDVDIVSCDVLVIGGGGAGLRAAIASREAGADVLLVSKSRVGFGSNTVLSAGSFAVPSGWYDSRDNPDVHLEDTVIGGRFINDQKLVAAVSREVGKQVSFLEKCGVNFSTQRSRPEVATQPPGHSFSRHVRSEHGAGKDFTVPLRKYAQRIGVRFAEKVLMTRLFTSNGRAAAATGITEDNHFLSFWASCLVLATGGFAQVYWNNDNAAGVTGDGLVLASQLGVPLRDMEFIQFYPTALGSRGSRILLYEGLVVRGGAKLRNSVGEDIIAKHGLSDIKALTRDRLTRAIMQEILEHRDVNGGVIVDISSVPEPLLRSLRSSPVTGIPSGQKELVVSPTAHFCMGGVITNESAETEVPGLFGAGEVCGGFHGANRLAGNSLAEVFAAGDIAGKEAALKAKATGRPKFPGKEITTEKARLESLISKGGQKPEKLRRSLKEVMWQKVGIIRQGKDLEEALVRIEELESLASRLEMRSSRDLAKSLELHNMLLLSEMVCRAALLRKESRGAHYRSDYPQENDTAWLKNIVIRRQDTEMKLETVEVSFDVVAPP